MKLEKVVKDVDIDLENPIVRELPPIMIRRSSSNNMMCVVEFEALPVEQQAEVEDIFAVNSR